MGFIGLSKPTQQKVSNSLELGDLAPASRLGLTDSAFSLVAFLRHTGCPFAEATVKQLSECADKYPEIGIHLVCHGKEEIAKTWIEKFNLSPKLNFKVDSDRELYGSFGLGYSSTIHLMHPKVLWGVAKLLPKGIRNRSASGTRWQKAGSFILDRSNKVVWKHEPETADEVPNFEDTIKQVLNI